MVLPLDCTALWLEFPALILVSGPSVFLAFLTALALVFSAYFFIDLPRQRRNKERWLREHADALECHRVVRDCLHDWSVENTACCKCGSSDLVLWDHRDELLVFQCNSCRINHTYTPGSGPISKRILNHISGEYELAYAMREYRGELLGAHIRDVSGPCHTFLLNKLQQH